MRDFGRERASRIVAVRLRLVVEDLDDGSSEGVRERQQRELDDRIVLRAETRRLAVDVGARAEAPHPPLAEASCGAHSHGPLGSVPSAGNSGGTAARISVSHTGSRTAPRHQCPNADHGPGQTCIRATRTTARTASLPETNTLYTIPRAHAASCCSLRVRAPAPPGWNTPRLDISVDSCPHVRQEYIRGVLPLEYRQMHRMRNSLTLSLAVALPLAALSGCGGSSTEPTSMTMPPVTMPPVTTPPVTPP